MATVRETSEALNTKLTKEVKEASQASAETANFLSRYIDEEVQKIGNRVTK